jgi:hypothetical protein
MAHRSRFVHLYLLILTVPYIVSQALDHLPILGVGGRLVKHYELSLLRYDNAAIPYAARLLLQSPDNMRSAKLRTSVLRYSLSTPSSPIGPEDLLSNYIYLQPLDPRVIVRSASLTVERRLNLHHLSTHAPSRNSLLPDLHLMHQEPSHAHSLPSPSSPLSLYEVTGPSSSSLADSNTNLIRHTIPSQTPVTSTSSVAEPSKVSTSTIISTEVYDFSRDSSGMWTKHITAQWPSRKKFIWSSGETLTTEMATVKFYIRVRVRQYFLFSYILYSFCFSTGTSIVAD